MNIKNKEKNVVLQQGSNFLREINIFYQYLCSEKQLLMLEAFSSIKRSRNELEKPFNKL